MTRADYLDAWLQGYLAGCQRGYEERVTEENDAWKPQRIYFMGTWYDRALERERWYAEARAPTDQGGP